MYELPCRDCLTKRGATPAPGVDLHEGSVDYTILTSATPSYPTYNHLQRYLCRQCGYAWTDRRSAEWESVLTTIATSALITAVMMFGLEQDWGFPLVLVAMVVTFAAIKLTDQLRSTVEDWLDPAENTCRRV